VRFRTDERVVVAEADDVEIGRAELRAEGVDVSAVLGSALGSVPVPR
jgi:hypothetical protein